MVPKSSSLFLRFFPGGASSHGILATAPAHGMRYAPEEDLPLSTLEEDAFFLLEGKPAQKGAGWYMLELEMELSRSQARIDLCLDDGSGFHEKKALSLLCSNSRIAKRIVRFHQPSRRLRFHVSNHPLSLSILHFRLARLTGGFAKKRMLRKLSNAAGSSRTPREIAKRLRGQAREQGVAFPDLLYERYDALFRQPGWGDAAAYEEWIENVERPVFEALDARLANNTAILRSCLISVIMPVYNTDPAFLIRAIESVRRQSYPHWELCICDDASDDDAVREIIREAAVRDGRIKCIFRGENGHICAASNDALGLVTGDFIAFLDHDDELARHALYFVARAVEENPRARLFYSDEDFIDTGSQRRNPHFKPCFNRDLLYSHNYITHFSVYHRDIVGKVGGFRAGVEGSQDYDLLLRSLVEMDPADIVHIPQILYHWRAIEGSTALDAGYKDYTVAAGIDALRHHFRQIEIPVKVAEGPYPNTYRVRWPIPDPPPLVSLLIPTRNRLDLLGKCIDSILRKTAYPNYEIIIIDNGSDEPATLDYLAEVEKQKAIRVLPYDRPFNYSAINNFAAKHARGQLLGLINNDVEVIEPDWLTEMVSQALRPDIGCVGAKLLYSDDTVQHGGVILGIGGVAGHSHKGISGSAPGYFDRLQLVQNLSAVTGACLVVEKKLFERAGGLNEAHLPIAYNDVDLCLRIRALGVRNLYTPHAVLYHHESRSRGCEDTLQKQARARRECEYMRKTWANLLDSDPCYSPHLTKAREDFSIATPVCSW